MINQRYFSFLIIALCATGFLLGSTNDLWGQTTTLGAVFCNAFDNTKPFGKLFSWIAYLAGAFSGLQGIHHFRGHTENQQNHPLRNGSMLWAGAACLLALPSAAGAIISSLTTQAGAGLSSCTAPEAGGGGQTLDEMLAGFVTNIKAPLVSLVSVIAIVAGVWMIVHGFMKASKHGIDARSNSIHSITANLVFGAVLTTIGTTLNTMLASVFGTGVTSNNVGVNAATVTGWGFVAAVGGGSAQFGNAVAAALTFFQLIGVIAFVRGWLIMKKVVEGGGNVTMGQGITHIVGGVLAINIGGFLKIMDVTFGTNLM